MKLTMAAKPMAYFPLTGDVALDIAVGMIQSTLVLQTAQQRARMESVWRLQNRLHTLASLACLFVRCSSSPAVPRAGHSSSLLLAMLLFVRGVFFFVVLTAAAFVCCMLMTPSLLLLPIHSRRLSLPAYTHITRQPILPYLT